MTRLLGEGDIDHDFAERLRNQTNEMWMRPATDSARMYTELGGNSNGLFVVIGKKLPMLKRCRVSGHSEKRRCKVDAAQKTRKNEAWFLS